MMHPDVVPCNALVQRALRLMESSPEKRWTVELLARSLGTSRSALARSFHAELGEPPLTALRGVRMQRAKEMLEHTDANLVEVADAVGYDSEFAFSRAFLRHFGVRPGQVRRSSGAPLAPEKATMCLAA